MDEKRQNREIKFRAWDIDSSTMVTYDQLDNGEWFIGVPKHGLSLYSMHPDHDEPEERDAVLMQFTGLKDKHGKDIYEGDIDSHGRHIEYRDGAFHVVQNNGQTFDYLSHMKHIEIIGNIYQRELSES